MYLELLLIFVAMGLVTFIPRLLPVFIMDRLYLPVWADRWLRAIPYAALGALIFPGILFIEEGAPWVGLSGGLVAVILALWRLPILYTILGAIGTVLAVQWFTG